MASLHNRLSPRGAETPPPELWLGEVVVSRADLLEIHPAAFAGVAIMFDRSRTITQAELAAQLGYSTAALSVWRKKGIGPSWFRTETGRIFYLREEVEKWLHKQPSHKHAA